MATLDQWMKEVQKFTEATNTRLDALEKRVAEWLEKPSPVIPMRGEWVRGNGLMPANAYYCTCGAGNAAPDEHDKDCPHNQF